MDETRDYVAEAIRARIAATPDDYYISDDGETLWALLAGEYLWSMKVEPGKNFHAMTEAKIAVLIHENLSEKLG